jgi:hypothetical protein
VDKSEKREEKEKATRYRVGGVEGRGSRQSLIEANSNILLVVSTYLREGWQQYM